MEQRLEVDRCAAGHAQWGPRNAAAARIRGVACALLVLAAVATAAGCGSASALTTQANRTPTPTPTAQQRIAALAQQAIGGNVHVEATLGTGSAGTPGPTPGAGDDGAVTVTVTLAGPVPGTDAEISASQERVKTICFQAERALWTAALPLSDVTVTVVGPIYDDYADLTSGPYGAAVLKADTAAKLDWVSLSPDTAWDVYGVFLRAAYRPKTVGL